MAKRDSTPGSPLAKTKTCHTRHIKIGKMVYDYRRKDQSQAKVPWLQLKGQWLEHAGFAIDSPVTVRVMQGCLVVTANDSG